MIDPAEPCFPNNVVELLAVAFQTIDSDLIVLKRPLRQSDPGQCIGVFAALWETDEQSYEIGSRFPSEPTLARYQLGVQAFVKDSDEQRGLAAHSVLSKRVRSVLYHSVPLRLALSQLSVSDGDSIERTTRWGIRTQRYMNNDVGGQFVYLSTLDNWLETETS